jgi:iron(III) transport system permease protein
VLGQVAALALILAALAVAGLAARAFFAARAKAAIEQSSAPFEGFALGRWRAPVETATWVMVTGVAVMPLLALMAGSLSSALGVPLNSETATLNNYRFVLDNDATRRAFSNSFVLALTAALASIAIAVPLAYFAAVQRRPTARALDLVADMPYAIPGTVLAIGVILLFLRPLPVIDVSIYGTIWILLAAYVARFLALGLRPTMAGMELVNRALDEAGQVAGAGVIRRLRSIMLPLIAPSAAAGALLIFMTAFNELTVSALLWSTGNETLGVTVFHLHYEGNSPAAAALATLSIGVTLGLAVMLSVLGRHLPPGVIPWRA